MRLFTIGFTKKTAQQFFEILQSSGAKRLVDIRLNNVSQLAGFAKKNDLEYFLEQICGMDYLHLPLLAPTQDILDEYKKLKGDWQVYERQFLALLEKRRVEANIAPDLIAGACLLCSEDSPLHCHRRLVAEYLAAKWGEIEIVHLQ